MRCSALQRATVLLGLAATLAFGHAVAEGQEDASLRELIKQGKLRTCITDTIELPAPNPLLVFKNECDQTVHVTLCVRVPGEKRAYYVVRVRPHAEARHRLMMKQGEFVYSYNTCTQPYCSAPEPQC